MEKLKKIGIITLGIIFALSSAMLSFQLIVVNYTNLTILITTIVSFVCAAWFYKKTIKENYINIKNNIIFTIICIILSMIVLIQLYRTKGVECKGIFEDFIINPFKIRYFFTSAISIMYIFIYLGNRIKKWAYDFYNALDSWDKKAYIIASAVSFVIIVIAYSLNSKWFLQYDKVYSLDSGYCFNNILPKSTYYDIRHPILSIFTFPIWAIVNAIVKVIIPNNLSLLITAIVFQLINAQLLILIGLQIKILSKSKIVFILYMLSFTTILYFLFFEKYQLCTFLVVLYVFNICNAKEKSSASLIAAAGAMPTSCVIGAAELLTHDKIKDKMKKILKIIFATLLMLICLGRAHVLKYGISEITKTKRSFSNTNYTIQQKATSTTNMIQSCFIALPSGTNIIKEKYWWDTLKDNISIISIIIIALIIIGAIKNRKSLFTKISSIWLLFSIILFVLLNWSPHESPLFAIYFSWAIIPLFAMGLKFIIEKAKLNPKIVYGCIITLMIIVNITTMIDINRFLG